MLIGHHHAQLAGDELGAEIVWMTAERRTVGSPAPLEQRAQIGNEAIVARHQLVELPAARDVLIFEQLRLSRLRRPQNRLDDLVVNRGQLGADTGEEPRDHREAVRDRGRRRRPERQRRAGAGEPVDARRGRPLPSNRPHLVTQMLLHQGDFGLHRQFDIGQCSLPGCSGYPHVGTG